MNNLSFPLGQGILTCSLGETFARYSWFIINIQLKERWRNSVVGYKYERFAGAVDNYISNQHFNGASKSKMLVTPVN